MRHICNRKVYQIMQLVDDIRRSGAILEPGIALREEPEHWFSRDGLRGRAELQLMKLRRVVCHPNRPIKFNGAVVALAFPRHSCGREQDSFGRERVQRKSADSESFLAARGCSSVIS